VAGPQALQVGEHHSAVLLLEAEVKRSPEAGEGWQQLGITQAEMDNDTQAIAALLKAVEADSANLDALLELGVSCTNELDQTQALVFLQTWLQAHPIHGAALGDAPEMDPHHMGFMAHVTEQFRGAAAAGDDADVHLALGVLANLRQDYEDAIVSFKHALRLRPQSHSLWNKLGATSANGGKSKEAIHAYNQALQLKPTYIRSWANSGIAHSNMGDHGAATVYFLRALVLNPHLEHLWDNLTSTFAMINRPDLSSKLQEHNVELFRDEFPSAFPTS